MNLIGTMWVFFYNLDEGLETTITFTDVNNAISGSKTRYTWRYINRTSILIDLNGIVQYYGTISNGKITGQAFNITIGRSWLWEAQPYIAPVIKVNPILTTEYICQKWELENFTDELENDEILFLKDGNLFSNNFGKSTWIIENKSTLLFWCSNNYLKYKGGLIENKIVGNAKNKVGYEYHFELSLINARQYKQLKLNPSSELGYFTNQAVFKIKGEKKRGFPFYSLYDYYPKRYSTIDRDIIYVRHEVYDFKNGKNSSKISKLISKSIENEPFFDSIKNNAMLCVIPASTTHKNNIRFKWFCTEVATELSIINGFNAINVLYDRKELKGKKEENKTDNLIFDSTLIKGRDILLFDDVITRGTSFYQNSIKLMENGAKSIIGIFLAQTVYCDY